MKEYFITMYVGKRPSLCSFAVTMVHADTVLTKKGVTLILSRTKNVPIPGVPINEIMDNLVIAAPLKK